MKPSKRKHPLTSFLCDGPRFVCSVHGSRAAHTHISGYFTHSTHLYLSDSVLPLSSELGMAGVTDLKFLLESSLNEIFKATVTDILDSVDRTLSDYQSTIRRIELENEDLRRQLSSVQSAETAARGTIAYSKSPRAH